jgi:hypothetical protein
VSNAIGPAAKVSYMVIIKFNWQMVVRISQKISFYCARIAIGNFIMDNINRCTDYTL